MSGARDSTKERAVREVCLEVPGHGGRLAWARRTYPDAPEPFLDLSTGINPYAYPLPALAPACFARLPEPEAVAALEAAAAKAYRAAQPALVAAAPGTQILINLLPRVFPLRRVAVLSPTYSEHAAAWAGVGAQVREIATLDQFEDEDGLVLCNPNNPDGRVSDPDHLEALAASLAARGGLLVVDEAFADFAAPGLSLVPRLPLSHAIVLRSFGKAYGLAGVRLGFALAAPAVADSIRAALGPWALSGPAIEVGRRGLADQAWRDRTAARLEAAAARLDLSLAHGGLRVLGGTCLFRLGAALDAPACFERLARGGILVRRFADQPAWLRFGLPADEHAWTRLDRALSGGPVCS